MKKTRCKNLCFKFQVKEVVKKDDTTKTFTGPAVCRTQTAKPKNIMFVDGIRATIAFQPFSANNRCIAIDCPTCHLQKTKVKVKIDHLFTLNIVSACMNTQLCSILNDVGDCSRGSVFYRGSSRRPGLIRRNRR